jgi:hypothetical protein
MHVLLLLANSHAFRLRTHYFNRLLGLDLGELHGVLGVFLFLELNGFGFLVHNAAFRRWLMVAQCPLQSRQNILNWRTVGVLDFVRLGHQERQMRLR